MLYKHIIFTDDDDDESDDDSKGHGLLCCELVYGALKAEGKKGEIYAVETGGGLILAKLLHIYTVPAEVYLCVDGGKLRVDPNGKPRTTTKTMFDFWKGFQLGILALGALGNLTLELKLEMFEDLCSV